MVVTDGQRNRQRPHGLERGGGGAWSPPTAVHFAAGLPRQGTSQHIASDVRYAGAHARGPKMETLVNGLDGPDGHTGPAEQGSYEHRVVLADSARRDDSGNTVDEFGVFDGFTKHTRSFYHAARAPGFVRFRRCTLLRQSGREKPIAGLFRLMAPQTAP